MIFSEECESDLKHLHREDSLAELKGCIRENYKLYRCDWKHRLTLLEILDESKIVLQGHKPEAPKSEISAMVKRIKREVG